MFVAALGGTFVVLVQEAKYGLFRIQRNSLTVQADALAAQARFVDGKPTLDLGRLAEGAGKSVSYALLSSEGRVLQSHGMRGIDVSPAVLQRYDTDDPFGFSIERWFDPRRGDPVMLILPDESGAQRIVVTAPAGNGHLVQVSMPLLDSTIAITDVMYTFTESSIVVVLLPLLLAMVAIPVIVRLTLRPIRRLSREAAAIGATTLDRRLSLHRVPSEMSGLVLAFNDLLARLDASWRLQRDFTANAAHELRTPIAALRAEVEAMVQAPARAKLAVQFDKVARLLAQLLSLAEADSRPVKAEARFDLVALARKVVADMAPGAIAAGKEIAIECDGDVEAIAWGHAGLGEIALRNLVDNAVRHSAQDSAIRVIVEGTLIAVENTGSSIDRNMENAMFQRFWKQDRRTSGSGLGLSIVKAIMKRLGGSVAFTSSGETVVFTLNFRADAAS